MYFGKKNLMRKMCYRHRPRKTMSKDVIVCSNSRQKITRGMPPFTPTKIVILEKCIRIDNTVDTVSFKKPVENYYGQ